MSILTNLISYWDLSEASGTRADGVVATGNTLTDNNSVTGAAGPGSHNASVFNGSTQFLSHTSNASLQMPNSDFTMVGWVYTTRNNVQQMIWSKDNSVSSGRDYAVELNSNVPQFYTSGAANQQSVSCADHVDNLSTWYFVAAWNDSGASQLKISLNNGTATANTYTGAITTSTTSGFNVGRAENNSGEKYLAGRIAMCGIWKKLLTGAELTTLYNSGSGLSYAELVATVPADRIVDPAAPYRSLFMTL